MLRRRLFRTLKRLKLAIVGSRGIPSSYGGFETVAELLARGLPRHGFEVYVFCERALRRKTFTAWGVRRVFFPVWNAGRLVSEVIYDIVAIAWASIARMDIIYLMGYSATPACVFPRLLGTPVLVNVDGIEWKRAKFHKGIQIVLKVMEKLTTVTATRIVVDSRSIGEYYRRKYGIPYEYLPYPGRLLPYSDEEALTKGFGLHAQTFYLIVARLEPENNIELLIDGYLRSKSQKALVVVGSLQTKYGRYLYRRYGNQIRFVGTIYNEEILGTLRHFCFACLHGHEVGGTSPTLIESMMSGNLVIAYDTTSNRETAEDGAFFFGKSVELLAELIVSVESADPTLLEGLSARASTIAIRKYGIETAIQVHARTFILSSRRHRRAISNEELGGVGPRGTKELGTKMLRTTKSRPRPEGVG